MNLCQDYSEVAESVQYHGADAACLASMAPVPGTQLLSVRWPILRSARWRQVGLNQTDFFFSISSSCCFMLLGPFSKQKGVDLICSWHGSFYFWNQDLSWFLQACLAYSSGLFWFHQPSLPPAQSYRYYCFSLYPAYTTAWQVSLCSWGNLAF